MKNEKELKAIQARRKRKRLEKEKQTEASQQLKQDIAALGDTIESLANKIEEQDQIDLAPLSDAVSTLTKKLEAKDNESQQAITKLVEQVRKIKPTVNIPPAKTITKLINEDIYDLYKAANSDTTGAMQYFGFVRNNGNWFILRISGDAEQTFKYAAGTRDYEANWGGKETLTYMYYHEVQI